ncbi:SUBTILISIN-LIKE PROTEASE SBT4.5 [Salix viminalis]|uniref:SUBTILISIN-LIKE PROTEASE SBT4.5 n=1 Tax=Salix viminalis TaxID=40686 RepID=A0A9Q0NIV3_SALVM|nr:SUBTILISIN-LIKE PROTEASE SBT4.5 [Salix viminalis]
MKQEYIVYMGSLPESEYLPSSHHLSMIQEVVQPSSSENVLVRSYKRSFNGFSAKLTSEEAQKLASKKEVVSIFPSTTLQLQTTRSWDFMGFNVTGNGKRGSHSDIVVGVIDTGVWPESESFNDDGFGPPPRKWRGVCEGGENFTCNNKIIGARRYSFSSARDDLGHGSHTASTAAGNIVKKASFYGLAQGTARGGVPSARISAYKVCGPASCQSSDILSAFDDAIADGVDIITISIGESHAQEFDSDVIAIGGFHSMAKGILTLQSAGNEGPAQGSVASVAPWIFTVAASSTDRRIIDKAVLGNGKTLGNSVNSFSLKGRTFPLVYGKGASRECKHLEASRCYTGCLNRALVKGKIVVCDNVDGRTEAKRAGALGVILPNSFEDVSFILPLPGLSLTEDKLNSVKSYLNSTKKPSANILKSEAIKLKLLLSLLVPDVSAPGVDILAAFPPALSPTEDAADKRHVK